MSFVDGTVAGFRGQRGFAGGGYAKPQLPSVGGTLCVGLLPDGTQVVPDGVETDVQFAPNPFQTNGYVDVSALPIISLTGSQLTFALSKIQVTAAAACTVKLRLKADANNTGFAQVAETQVYCPAGSLTQSLLLPVAGPSPGGIRFKFTIEPTGANVTVDGQASPSGVLTSVALFFIMQG